MKNANIVVVIAGVLIFLGVYNNPDFNWINSPVTPVVITDVQKPTDPKILEYCEKIRAEFSNSSSKKDIGRFAELMLDLSLATSLNGDKALVNTTREVREINSSSGFMMELKMKDKYPKVMELCNNLFMEVVGPNDVLLSDELRAKSVDCFKGICWASIEGSK